MREKFEDWKPNAETQVTVDNAIQIISEYQADGLILNLRQLYYRFVALDLFPEDRRWRRKENGKWEKDPNGTKNADPNYKWQGGIVSRGRLAGIIDWGMIEDRNRTVLENSHWTSPHSILQSAASTFQLDKWEDQENRIVVMCEKDALAGVLLPVCQELDVPFTACKGYSSQSHLYEIGKQIARYNSDEQSPIILYFGDHDPSGLDMDRDITERLSLFSGLHLIVERLALTMEQIEEQNPPPNPTKMSDSRAEGYIRKFGHESWELDALEPRALANLVRNAILVNRDDSLWDAKVSKEKSMIERLRKMANEWED